MQHPHPLSLLFVNKVSAKFVPEHASCETEGSHVSWPCVYLEQRGRMCRLLVKLVFTCAHLFFLSWLLTVVLVLILDATNSQHLSFCTYAIHNNAVDCCERTQDRLPWFTGNSFNYLSQILQRSLKKVCNFFVNEKMDDDLYSVQVKMAVKVN